jgi:two-component system, LytTR family, response regulator
MSRYRCLLIDDEPLALERLERLLSGHEEVEILGKVSRPSEAVSLIDTLQPDLLFLDIQMPGMTGFQVLERVRHQPVVIFVTAYDRYAMEAFEVNSIDYLLKPVQKERLAKALQKLDQLRTVPDGGRLEFEKVLDYLRRTRETTRKLVSRQGERMLLIEPSEVAYFYAASKYTFAVTSRGEFILDYTLQQLRQWLPEDKFLTIHRSYVVNLDCVAELARGFAGGLLCRLKSPFSKDLPISRSLVAEVRRRIQF